MQKELFEVRNVKCEGCASAIRDKLATLPGVAQVEVDVARRQVAVAGVGLSREQLGAQLTALGYPEV